MENTDPEACVLCEKRAVDAPRIHIRQELALDAPVAHRLALCAEHGEALRSGGLNPQQIIYAWATRAHADLYRNERLVLRPELRCLACDVVLSVPGTGAAGGPAAAAPEGDSELACAACGAVNVLGSALGHRVAVRMRALSR